MRRIRGPRFAAATAVSLPIETAPGFEAQFDFADVPPRWRGAGNGYTPNRMGFGNPTDPREVALRTALYDAMGGPPQYRPR